MEGREGGWKSQKLLYVIFEQPLLWLARIVCLGTCSKVVEVASFLSTLRCNLMPFPVSLLLPFPTFSTICFLAPKQFEQQQRNLVQNVDFRSVSLPETDGDPIEARREFIWLIRFVSCLSIWRRFKDLKRFEISLKSKGWKNASRLFLSINARFKTGLLTVEIISWLISYCR